MSLSDTNIRPSFLRFIQTTQFRAIFAALVLTGFLFSLAPAGRMQQRSRLDDTAKDVNITPVVEAPSATAAFSWSDNQPASRVLGQPNFVTVTPGTNNNKFTVSAQAVVDPTSGKVFVADTNNNRVLRFTSLSAATNGGAAESVFGQLDFVTGTAGATQSKMQSPQGLTIDSAGRLWVADGANNRVLRFDNAATKAIGANADGVLGQTLFTTNTPATTQSGMILPVGVFVNTAGRIWIADQNNSRVLRFDNAAGKANGANADGVLGQPLFTTNTPATTQNGMNQSDGVVEDSAGRLWVTDRVNSRVLRYDNAAAKANGANADGVLGQTLFTTNTAVTTQGGMANPTGVTVDSSGRLYVADISNNRVLIFNSAATLANGANAANVLGQPNFTTNAQNNGGVSASSLNSPYLVFFDESSQNLFVGDLTNSRVLRFGPAFVPAVWTDNQPATRVLGQAVFTTGTSGTGNNKFNGPAQAVVDPSSGKVFVTESGNNRVLRFTSVAAATNGGAAEAVLGQPDFVTTTQGTTQSKMYAPQGLTVDTAGRLWVTEYGNSRVLHFDNAATKTSGANADGVLGQALFTTSNPAGTQSGMAFPIGIFADIAGRLWVADFGHSRILRFDNAAAKANGANADGVLGQPDFVTNFPSAPTQSRMDEAAGVVGDSAGRIWVADQFHHRVLRFDNAAAKANGANADAVLGQPDFITSNTATTQNGMNSPIGVAVDSTGRLYVTDSLNNRVLIFNSAVTLANGANASNVLGQPNFTTGTANTSGLSASSLAYAYGIFFDEASQNLFVGDLNNNRVLRFGPAFVPTAAGVTVSGRVMLAGGRGLTNAMVTITDSQGVTRQAITTRRGSYQFDDVEAGQTYIIAVRSRRFTFTPQLLSVTDNLSNVDFIAQ